MTLQYHLSEETQLLSYSTKELHYVE